MLWFRTLDLQCDQFWRKNAKVVKSEKVIWQFLEYLLYDKIAKASLEFYFIIGYIFTVKNGQKFKTKSSHLVTLRVLSRHLCDDLKVAAERSFRKDWKDFPKRNSGKSNKRQRQGEGM